MLEGIRVLDAATLAAAPLAATYLGEFGADVIKIEQPDGGDPIRTWGNQVDGVGKTVRYWALRAAPIAGTALKIFCTPAVSVHTRSHMVGTIVTPA